MADDPDDPPMWRCPDGGHCHHHCDARCYRVLNAGPLSGEYHADVWPAALITKHRGDSRAR